MFFALIGLALLVTAGLMLDSHRRTWAERRAQLGEDRDKQAQLDWRNGSAEYRRRMQASGTVAVLGLLFGARDFIPALPLAMAIYLLLLVAGCLWVLVLAMLDAWAGMVRMSQATSGQEAARARLEHELTKARERAEQEATD